MVTSLDTWISYVVGFMDGGREYCERKEDDDDSEADGPSPYESDTENVDLEEFVESLSHEVNKWRIYQMNDLELELIGNGFFGDIYKVHYGPWSCPEMWI